MQLTTSPGALMTPGLLVRSVVVLAVVLAVLLVYWPGLNGPLILDDIPNLTALRSLDALGRLTFANLMQDRAGGIGARPVSMLSFFVNWKLAGGDIWFLKLTNLLIHFGCGAALYVLTRTLLERSDRALTQDAHWMATWVVAAWLLAPIQVSTVLYVVQRMAQLAAFFSLLGLAFYVTGRVDLARRPLRALVLMGSALAVCWPLAALSKENGVLLPLLLLITELFFFRPPSPRALRRLVYGGLGCCVLVPALVMVVKTVHEPDWVTGPYALRDFTLVERVLTQPRVLVDYFFNVLLLPGGTPLGLFHDDFEKSISLFEPWTTVLCVAIWAAVVIVAFRLRTTKLACLGYGLLFFLCAHSLEGSIFALELYFEHRNYLPAAGLFIALAGIVMVVSDVPGRRRLIAATLVLVLAGYGVTAGARVLVWTSWDDLIRISAQFHPRSVRAQAGMAVVHLRAGEPEKARVHLERVLALGGEGRRYGVVLKSILGQCIAHRDVPSSMLMELESRPVIVDDTYTVAALRWLRTVVLEGQCAGKVDLERLVRGLSRHVGARTGAGLTGHNWSLHYDTALLLFEVGRLGDARRHLLVGRRYAPPSQLPAFDAALRGAAAR